MNLKRNLREYLERLDITAAQLSRKSGVSKQVLSQWLGGGEPRKLSQVKKVADALGTTVDDLCFGDGVVKRTSRNDLASLLEDEGWIGGVFEIKVRRVKK